MVVITRKAALEVVGIKKRHEYYAVSDVSDAGFLNTSAKYIPAC
jgi:hypothetical protein